MAGWPVPISPSQAHFNREEATTARQSAERAQQRAYQTSAADMAAAGLNPILAATKGMVTQGGAQAAGSVSANSMDDASSAVSQRRLIAEQTKRAKWEADTAMQDNVVAKIRTQGWLSGQEDYYRAVREGYIRDEAEARAGTSAARIEQRIDDGPGGEASRYIQRYTGGSPVGAFSSALGALRHSFRPDFQPYSRPGGR